VAAADEITDAVLGQGYRFQTLSEMADSGGSAVIQPVSPPQP